MRINSYDIDGVIYLGSKLTGLTPRKEDIIITGRSFQETPETLFMLQLRDIHNQVFFNPKPFNEKTRETSGWHKANIINSMNSNYYTIDIHYEDDEIQADIIAKNTKTNVIFVKHDLVNKENQRHYEFY